MDGEQHDIVARYGDKAVRVVVFSCNHCPYVRAWEDRMVQTQADYADRGVQFVVISSNDTMRYPADSFEKMKERATEKQFNFPYLYDETQEVARTYGAERTPEFLCLIPPAPCATTARLTTTTKTPMRYSTPTCAMPLTQCWRARLPQLPRLRRSAVRSSGSRGIRQPGD
ncbi:MAG: redoxin domain-containing protein [Chloroflexaceae bacterium]|nr:redoxin domain-containing protein [Chloroflexaceae bacterium]